MSKLANKVALVTGASKGIGAAIARHLAAAGATVIVNYAADEAGAQRTVEAIRGAGGAAFAARGNVAREADVNALFEHVAAAHGRLDVLVNNAGVYAFHPFEEFSVAEYARQFDVNVRGLLLVTRAALPLFPATGGSIVNVSSVASTLAPPGGAVYSATKGAVDTITRTLAKELGPRKIRVNAVNPGLVSTEGTSGFMGTDFEKQTVAATPLGRVGEPDDIAPPVAFLASDEARWITGETLYVSGGAAI